MIVLTVVLVVVGLAFFIAGLLGAVGKLPGNPVVGLRIPEVRKTEELWNTAHRIVGPAWMGAGAAFIGAALITLKVSGWMWLVFALLLVGAAFLIGLGSALGAHAVARLDARAAQLEAAESSCCSSGDATSDSCCGDSSEAAGASDSASACCSEPGADANTGTGTGAVSAEACASGQACGSCSLNGSCEGGGVDWEAAQRAASAQDSAQA
ncbi:SdpI family protein [Corynebacterium sp. ACRPH]|uniref:SdpI family protein n=1 Tax=Corynebacterium sp. ACRPH TaxID=2918199 RepID=UPI001EF16344|nr:SdpI family protein [Corynebacterium sp. ACRPH]MCG7456653.1 SdpI family protein [Corynebacterium sp. ACRPH]